jgi:hypothetical protein
MNYCGCGESLVRNSDELLRMRGIISEENGDELMRIKG